MARGVLGNDPFRRGAALHPETGAPREEPPAPATSMTAAAGATPQAKAGVAKGASGSKDPKPTKARATPRSQAGSTEPARAAGPRAAKPDQRAKAHAKAAKAPNADRDAGAKIRPSRAVPPRAPRPTQARASTASTRPRTPGARAAEGSATSAASVRGGAIAARDVRREDRGATAADTSARHGDTRASAGDAGGREGPIASRHRNDTPSSEAATGAFDSPAREAPLASAPKLMLVNGASDAPPPPLAAEDADHEDLSTRVLRALGFARDLAAAGLQAPELVDALKVARGLARGALGGLGTHLGQKVDAYGRDPGLLSDLDPLIDLLYTRYWRVTVQGAVHVPAGPVLLVANHAGVVPYDGPILQQVMSRERPELQEARWLVEDQIFHAPFFGTVFNRLGALRACPENAQRLLSEGRPVFVFPEGAQGLRKPFSERGQLKRFGRGGFVKVALRAGVPIVPVAVVGAEETSPLLARMPGSIFGLGYVPLTPAGPLPLPARWMVRFGEPLETDGLGPDDANNLPVVQRLTERTRESIQGMRQALLRERTGMYR